MLDPTMTYSCGYFETSESTLEQASIAKYDRIIDQLEIEDHHRFLKLVVVGEDLLIGLLNGLKPD